MFRLKHCTGPLALLIGSVASGPVAAQGQWQLELRPTVSCPVHVSGGPGQGLGFGSETLVAYVWLPGVHVFAGSGWQEFHGGRDGRRWVEAGYRCGLRYAPPSRAAVRCFFEGGAAYDYIARERPHTDAECYTGHGLGWEAGGGIVVDIGPHFTLMPILRYQAITRRRPADAGPGHVTLDYLSGGLGAALRL